MSKLKIGCLGVIGLFVILMIFGALVGSGDKSSNSSSSSTKVEETKQKEYQAVDVSTLISELENNAAAAQKKYKGKDLKITGTLNNIDSDGDYISVKAPDDRLGLKTVHCSINKKDKAQEDYVLNLKKGQTVIAYGNINDVGEVIGYRMKVDKFE